jgi:hypothetical protein
MRKLIILMLLIATSCNKEDVQPNINNEPTVDCDCDRVVDV